MKAIVSVILLFLEATCAKKFLFTNSLSYTIWVGTLGNPEFESPKNGGFKLGSGRKVTVTTDDNWAGRFWARTGCRFDRFGNGSCETGDCGNKLQCNGTAGTPPASFAEFTLNGTGGIDYYDVTLAQGFNLPIQLTTFRGQDPYDKNNCGGIGCSGVDLNPSCPKELRQTDRVGNVVACKSACLAFDSDEYCCRGEFSYPHKCNPEEWPVNYPAYFKNACPGAYSYAYDDSQSTYTCEDSGYKITFG